jgi:hypothetical protein
VIIRDERERFGGGFRVIQYDPDGAGRCVPNLRPSDAEAEIDTFYEQRDKELKRLYALVAEGALSPIGLFLTYNNLTAKDVAPMVGLRVRAVERHATPAGFERATVEELKRYARVFDVGVADLFAFVFVHGDLEAEAQRLCDRLLARVDVRAKPGAGA